MTIDYRSALAVDDPNPFATTFVIRTRHATASSAPDLPIKQSTIMRIGTYLCGTLLSNEYSLGNKRHAILKEMSDDIATDILNKQIVAYARGDWPFDAPRPAGTSALQWWSNLMNHSSANILAVSIYDLLDSSNQYLIQWLSRSYLPGNCSVYARTLWPMREPCPLLHDLIQDFVHVRVCPP